jgi:hypothetical protein
MIFIPGQVLPAWELFFSVVDMVALKPLSRL